MALFSRANSNTFSLLNHCYCRKFTMSMNRLRSNNRVSISTTLRNKNNKLSPDTMFETEINKRRNEACRSLLIQVHSSKSHNDLYRYCTEFGSILGMHHYCSNHNNYILVEFEDTQAVSKIMSSASFVNKDNIVCMKSSVLWFSKGQITSKKDIRKVIPLSVQNGCVSPTDQEIAKLMFDAKTISGQIVLLYETLKLTDLEIRLRFHIAQHLEQYFSGLFDNIRVLPFGSSINGFGRNRCDLDLVVVPDNENNNTTSRLKFHSKYMEHDNRLKTKEFLNILATTMQNLIPGVFNVRKILEARVPIIKFCYDYTQTECDLSATNMTAIYMTELLYLYGEIDWRVRPLVIAIRVWAKSQELTSNVPGQWITNFPLTLLVLFYLQQKKILPSLKTLKLYSSRNDVRCAENGGIDCTFLRDISKLPADYKYKSNQENLETLLHGFFEYYSTFNFQMNGICIREGIKIRKPSRSPLHITNPLETTLNVSKNVTLYELDHIISKSHNALYALETADKSKNNSWGIMNIIKLNNIINVKKLNRTQEKQIIEQLSENHFYENSTKFEDSEVDEAKTKKKGTA